VKPVRVFNRRGIIVKQSSTHIKLFDEATLSWKNLTVHEKG